MGPCKILAYWALYSVRYGNHKQNWSHDCCGPAKAHGSKAKPASQVNATQSKESEGQINRKGAQ
jgi:hypothetical protein